MVTWLHGLHKSPGKQTQGKENKQNSGTDPFTLLLLFLTHAQSAFYCINRCAERPSSGTAAGAERGLQLMMFEFHKPINCPAQRLLPGASRSAIVSVSGIEDRTKRPEQAKQRAMQHR